VEGVGVAADRTRADAWLLKAFEQEDPRALGVFALRYLNGSHGMPKDREQGMRLLRQSAELGNSSALFTLGRTLEDAGDFQAAAKCFLSAARQGDAECQNLYGIMLAQGQGVPRNLEQAAHWYRKSAEQGHGAAQSNLGHALITGAGVKQDHAEAVHWLEKAAARKIPGAYCNLGRLYLHGQGVERNPQKGFELIQKSAASGDPGGMLNLAYCYDQGQAVERNAEMAVKWYRKCLEAGPDVVAYHNLGDLYLAGNGILQDEAEAARCYKAAADLGFWESEIAYARCLATGAGVKKNPLEAIAYAAKAADKGHVQPSLGQILWLLDMGDEATRREAGAQVERLAADGNPVGIRLKALLFTPEAAESTRLLRQAAELGDTLSMVVMGDRFSKGYGVEAEATQAAAWYAKAAERDDATGALRYAHCLLDGVGVARDSEQGHKWLLASAKLYDPQAQVEWGLALLARPQPDTAEALAWFRRAAMTRHAAALYELGRCYENGTGIQPDPVEAVAWFKKSARAGHVPGMVAYGKCLLNGTGVRQSEALAQYWFQLAAKQGSAEATQFIRP
jgi:hypothetical protein